MGFPAVADGFVIPAFAFAASLTGAACAVFGKGWGRAVVARLMAFAAGVMLALAFTELLPLAFEGLGVQRWLAVLLLAVGLCLAYIVESPADDHSGGAENMYSAGLMTAIAIMLHNVPEGMASFIIGCENPKLRVSYALAVVLHELPLGATAAAGIYCAIGSKARTAKIALITAFAQPVGALLAWLILGRWLTGAILGCVYAFMSGIVIYTALFELLPTALSEGERSAAPWVCAGVCFFTLLAVV